MVTVVLRWLLVFFAARSRCYGYSQLVFVTSLLQVGLAVMVTVMLCWLLVFSQLGLVVMVTIQAPPPPTPLN